MALWHEAVRPAFPFRSFAAGDPICEGRLPGEPGIGEKLAGGLSPLQLFKRAGVSVLVRHLHPFREAAAAGGSLGLAGSRPDAGTHRENGRGKFLPGGIGGKNRPIFPQTRGIFIRRRSGGFFAGMGGTGTLSTVCIVWAPMYRRISGLWLWMSGLLADLMRCAMPFEAWPVMGGNEGRCTPRPFGALLK